ncbi:MAG: hypothetical protein U1F40_13460 [Turneriella sp.]
MRISIFIDGSTEFNQIHSVDIYFYIMLAIGFSCGVYLLTRGLAMYVGDAVADRVTATIMKGQNPTNPKA